MGNTKTKFYRFMEEENLRAIDIRNATMGSDDTIGYQTIMDFRHGYDGSLPTLKTIRRIAAACSSLLGREVSLDEIV